MRVVRLSEHRPVRGGALRLLARFGLVGIAATILYAALVAILTKSERIGFTPIQASLAAYAAATLFSYLAHKSVTFVSGGPHQSEAPRFLVLAATGLAIAYGAPALLTVKLGLPLIVPVVVTCLLVPAVNFFVLDRWVFAESRLGRHGNRSA
ncbi:GtrA family protein [Mesorhizobium amorphae]|uniref:GtrA family protein n=1 Tax=Mesorhizobium amorphae TaxID=71433 RepID=UPI000B6C74C9|nr:GtrA family protein [Mesorhizobium amorphae]OWK22002.1 polysaccharide synthesis protein GtrA [Mesorhizobium amorphae CCBAU 01583]